MFEHVIYQVPRASLAAHRGIGAATALRVPAASGAGQLVSPYLRTLARPPRAGQPGGTPGEAFIDAGLDLAVSALRAVAGHPSHDARQGEGRCRSCPASEVKEYTLAHLGDPALSPQAAAQACFVSVRQVHRLFASEGRTFGGWVREQRLRRCRDDLADPRLGHLAVAEIATRWGFRSAAHFTRAFHARYGTTPSSARPRGRLPAL
jgi:AraC-like DNA-binding protein